jgi:DtxR family Mn-dependent transcriptional regulator
MATSTVEQYIKVIFLERQRSDRSIVQMKRLADAMHVTPGTATTMVKQLDRLGYIRYQPRKGVELLDEGRDLAVRIIRRHRLIETFLERVLDYDWSEVHDEAEHLEHAVSDYFIDRVDEYLGYPVADPHGDPIPSAGGVFSRTPSRPLTETTERTSTTIVRLSDDTKGFLDMIRTNHLTPGEEITVDANDPVARIVAVRNSTTGHSFVMGYEIAERILVSVSGHQ